MSETLNYNDVFREPDPRYRYRRPDAPLRIEEGIREGAIPIPEQERQLLLRCARWEINPPFHHEGRSGLAIRKQPLDIDGTTIAAYKLKAVAHCDGDANLVSPPSNETYVRKLTAEGGEHPGTDMRERLLRLLPTVLIHMGVNDDGSFRAVPDPEKPLGGLGPNKGRREFENAVRLHRARIAACGPITWGRYPDLDWKGDPMEFVILSLISEHPERVRHYFEPDTSRGRYEFGPEMKGLIAQCFDTYDPNHLEVPALKISSRMARANGKVLRQAHEQGDTCRFAGHTGNFTYHPQTRSSSLHDFDSSVGIDELHPNAIGLSFIRDIGSALFGMLHSVANSNLYYLVGNEARFKKENPVGQVLSGYFQGDADDSILSHAIEIIGENVVQWIQKRGEYPSVVQQSDWMTEAFEHLPASWMKLCFAVYKKSRLMQRYPLPYTDEGTLERHLHKFYQDSNQAHFQRCREIAQTLPIWARMMMGM